MKHFQFQRLYIPTGEHSTGEMYARDQRQLLDELNRYNNQAPGRWKYWATPAQLVSGRSV